MKKVFALLSNNEVIAYANLKQARTAHRSDASYFGTIDELAAITAQWSGSRLVEFWNSIPGNTEVKKFTDRKTALRRIWNAVQSLSAPDAPATPEAKVEEAEHASEGRRRASKTAEPKPPRDTKKALVMRLIARKDGATNQEIQEATEWQAHTIRGFLSIAKKHGASIEVIKRADEARAYHLAQ